MPGMVDRPRPVVDSRRRAYVSFAPPDPVALGPRGRLPTHAPIAVGPGRAVTAMPDRVRAERGAGVSYPIQPGKVQAPALRDETLARTRLLDWLEAKIHSRVIFVIADAGYGKTTLLADFSRRTRHRTIWYRLDEEDRDWVGFLSHLVAAGREHDPDFGQRTAAMLRSLEPGGPTRDDVVEAFVTELPSLASEGAALIFDDFHLADEVADVRQIAREIVARAPERLTVIFASRRQPQVPVSKLRAMGEVAELGIADLRFSDAELEQLFRETYKRPLEPDVLADLAKRTEGWAASLTLVQAALRERSKSETRSFIRSLSGARDELHDYLAEEVVGDLPQIHQQFLMRTSVLQVVTPELAQVATNLSAVEVQSLILESERLGLLGRRPNRRSTAQRYHPLVREFLEARLLRELGRAGVDELHVTVARWAESTDWRTAAHHFASAQRWDDLQRVLDTHVETIVGSGAFLAAASFVDMLDETTPSSTAEIVRSRAASVTGDLVSMLRHAERALVLDPTSDTATINLIASNYVGGDLARSIELGARLAVEGKSQLSRDIAEGVRMNASGSIDGDLREIAAYLDGLAQRNRDDGHRHYEGVSLLNLSLTWKAIGDADRALNAANQSIDALTASSSGMELVSARFAQAWAIAWRGGFEEARLRFAEQEPLLKHALRSELQLEIADLEVELGSLERAERAFRLFAMADPPKPIADMSPAPRALVELRRGNYEQAWNIINAANNRTPTPEPGRLSRVLAIRSLVAIMAKRADAKQLAIEAETFSDRQRSARHRQLASLVIAACDGRLGPEIVAIPEGRRPVLSVIAELAASRLELLGDDAIALIVEEAGLRPDRWLDALRPQLRGPSGSTTRLAAARILDVVGERSDIAELRRIAREPRRTARDRQLGRGLARRLAYPAVILDLGRVRVVIGDRELGGGDIRRKVLALLCYLLSRPRMTATREEVMEALWPDMDPVGAINSLNQAVYFLRRVFEPDYQEDLSPNYLHQESDLVFLDDQLVSSASARCAALISAIDRHPSREMVDDLSEAYTGKFAADFAYEDWASDFRDWLHVGYLQIVETEIANEIADGRFERGLRLARRALEVDPRLDTLGLSLLRMLKSSGAHSAAAEQYGRYASLLRSELGVEPPPFDSV